MLWHCDFSHYFIFWKHFLLSHHYKQDEVIISYPHNFLHISQKKKEIAFWLATLNLSYLPKINEKLRLFYHIVILGYTFSSICQELIFLQICVTNYEGLTLPHLLNILKDWSRIVFRKYGKFQILWLPYFLFDFHDFVPFCGEIFSLSHKMMKHLVWSCPLSYLACCVEFAQVPLFTRSQFEGAKFHSIPESPHLQVMTNL